MSTLPRWDRLTWDARRRALDVLEIQERALQARREAALTEARDAIAKRDEALAELYATRRQVDDLKREAGSLARTIRDLSEIARQVGHIPPDIEGTDRLREAAEATKRNRRTAA